MTVFRLETKHEVSFLACGPMCQSGAVMHAFSTGVGGNSEPPYASLNLGFGSGDSRACVLRNRAPFGQAVGFTPDDLMSLRQVHGNQVIVVTEASDPSFVQGMPGNGMIINCSRLPLAIITADCFSVVIAAPSLPAVGILHAGRRGTAARVVPTAIALMCEEFKVSPEAVFVAIGPGIGGSGDAVTKWTMPVPSHS